MSTELNVVDIFEVFKLNSQSRDSLVSSDIETVKKSYVELVPIVSQEQLLKATAIAKIPESGRVVVDQQMFAEAIAKKGKEFADKKSSYMLKKSETLVENMRIRFSEDVNKTLDLLKIIIDTEFEKTRELFKSTLNDTEKSIGDVKSGLEEGLVTQEKMYHKIIELISKKKGEILEIEAPEAQDSST